MKNRERLQNTALIDLLMKINTNIQDSECNRCIQKWLNREEDK